LIFFPILLCNPLKYLKLILLSIFQNLKSSIKLEIYFFSKTIAFSLFQGKIILGLYDNFKKIINFIRRNTYEFMDTYWYCYYCSGIFFEARCAGCGAYCWYSYWNCCKNDFFEILGIIGKSFVDNRLMSIFLISLPVIAVLERYGLRERSAALIEKLKNATAGRILGLYMVIRSIASALSIRIGGHIQFIRPLIYPMSEAAAKAHKNKDLTEKQTEELKSLSAAIENYGNFFSQNIFVGASGLLLIQTTLKENGYAVSLKQLALSSIPIGIIAIIFTFIQVYIYDKKIILSKGGKK